MDRRGNYTALASNKRAWDNQWIIDNCVDIQVLIQIGYGGR